MGEAVLGRREGFLIRIADLDGGAKHRVSQEERAPCKFIGTFGGGRRKFGPTANKRGVEVVIWRECFLQASDQGTVSMRSERTSNPSDSFPYESEHRECLICSVISVQILLEARGSITQLDGR